MYKISNLNMKTRIDIDGVDEPLYIDFTDRRLVNKLIKLVKRYRNIEEELNEKLKEIDNYEDEFDKLEATSDIETEVLESFKKDVDDTFNTDLTEKMFGDCLPSIERYFKLFDMLQPLLLEAKEVEQKEINEINEKYGLGRLNKNNK